MLKRSRGLFANFKGRLISKLKNFPLGRCTKILSFGEYNKGYEVTKSCRLLHPNCFRWSQLLISLTLSKMSLRSILDNVRGSPAVLLVSLRATSDNSAYVKWL